MLNNQGRKGASAAAPKGAAKLRKELLKEIRAMGGNPNPPSRNTRNRSQSRVNSRIPGQGPAFSAPAATGRQMTSQMPSMNYSKYAGDGRIRVRHREYVGTVDNASGFTVSSSPINPGQVGMFPWLSVIAANFETYLFNSLNFEYSPFCPSSTKGSVVLAIDYDAADPVPTSKGQTLQYHNAVRSVVWQECCCRSDKGDNRKFGIQRFIRPGALPPNTDIKTYDLGNFLTVTGDGTDTDPCGDLFVTYDVELITPIQGALPAAGVGQKIVSGDPSAADDQHFFDLPIYTGVQVASSLGKTLTFLSKGQWLVEFTFTGNATWNDTLPTFGGTSTVHLRNQTAHNHLDPAANELLCSILVQTAIAGQTVTVDLTSTGDARTAVTRIAPYLTTNA